MKNDYYTAEEAAKILNLKRPTLYKLARTNKLPTVKVGGSILFEKIAVETYGTISSSTFDSLGEKKTINYWMIPRSVRKLITLQAMIKNDYLNGIIGGKWKGTRSNHRRRDLNLQVAAIRGSSVGGFVDANPGGARTDVALLAALGFYAFDDAGNIQLTYQGHEMLSSDSPAKIITQQLFQFRYPSPYSTSINMDPSFELLPYRFLFKLLTTEKLKDDGSVVSNDGIIRLTQKEIAYFVITEAHTDSDFDKVVQLILESRRTGIIEKESKKLENIANTFINNIEITGFIERGYNSSLNIKPDSMSEVKDMLSKKPRNFKYQIGKEFEFQDRLGMDPTKSKYTKSQTSNRQAGEKAVEFLLLDFLSNNPMTIKDISSSLIEDLANNVGTTEAVARKVVSSVLQQNPMDIFSKQYLEYSLSGRAFARDFEILTSKIFMELIGNSKWVGKEGKSPDIIFDLEVEYNDKIHCIVDCKAEKKYTISNDHFNRMTVEDSGYIPAYNADNFIYVANDFSSSFEKNLIRIQNKCNIPGSGIKAADLLYILSRHRETPLTHKKLYELFAIGKIITLADINSAFITKD